MSAYPNVDESGSMAKGLGKMWWEVLHWIVNVLVIVLVTIGGVFALYYQDFLFDKFSNALLVFEPLFDRLLAFLEMDPEASASATASVVQSAVTGHSEL